jgi:sugar phosphate isomerase/epimerase
MPPPSLVISQQTKSGCLAHPLISTVAFRDADLFDATRSAHALGYQGIELWQKHLTTCKPELWEAVESVLRQKKMMLPVVAPFLSFTRGPERLAQTWKDADHALRVAERFGSRTFRVFTDVGRDGLGSAQASESQWMTVTGEIARLCQRNPEILFVAELHPNTLTDTPESTLRLLEGVAEENFRLNFQFIPSFLTEGWEAALRQFLPYTAHMHWQQVQSDGRMGYLSECGLIDFPKVAHFLAKAKYQGTISVEYCWPDTAAGPMREDRDLLKRIPEFFEEPAAGG